MHSTRYVKRKQLPVNKLFVSLYIMKTIEKQKITSNLYLLQTLYPIPGEKNRKIDSLLNKTNEYVYYKCHLDKHKMSNTMLALKLSSYNITFCDVTLDNIKENINKTIILPGLKTTLTDGIRLYENVVKHEMINLLPPYCHIFVVGGVCLPIGILSGIYGRNIHIHIVCIVESEIFQYKMFLTYLYMYYHNFSKSFDKDFIHFHSINKQYGEKLDEFEEQIKQMYKDLMLDDVYTLRTFIESYKFSKQNTGSNVYFFNSYSNKTTNCHGEIV